MGLSLLALVAAGLAGCGSGTEGEDQQPPQAQVLDFQFESGTEGWTAGFVDLPADFDPDAYQLQSGQRPLPASVGVGGAFFLSGNNGSDDLFMFLKRQVAGLLPNTAYGVAFTIDIASNAPEGAFGIGGAPGESVYLKAGAAPVEPAAVTDEEGWLRLNVDTGDQSQGGQNAQVLGNIAVSEDAGDDRYERKTLTNAGNPLRVTTSANGTLWLLVGTDSGFEGVTSLYYDRIRVEVRPE